MELTIRLLCGAVILMTHLLLLQLPAAEAVEEGIPSLSSLRGYGNSEGGGMQSLSRQKELAKALQFLEEYERNLEDAVEEEEEEEEDYGDDRQPNLFPYFRGGMEDEDEDIVPDFWDTEDPMEDEADNTQGQFMNVLQNVLQSAYRNRNDIVPQRGYLNSQRSTFNSPYELFSPVDADLEDELALEEAIVRLEFKAKKQRLWDGILKDMLTEEVVENDAQERINELMDLEEEEEEMEEEELGQDSIFEEDDPWTELESSSVDVELDYEDSDIVPWNWPGEESILLDDDDEELLAFDDSAESLSSEEATDIEREAAALILEEMLAEDQERQDEEEEEEEAEQFLEMIAGDDESADVSEEEFENEVYDKDTEDAIALYFRKMLMEDGNGEGMEEETLEEVSNEIGDDSASSEEEIWEESSSVDNLVDLEELEEAIQDYDDENEDGVEEEDYDLLLREITNEIEAAAQEVEDEVVEAFRNQLEENQNNLDLYEVDEPENEDYNLVVDKKGDDSTEDELDAEELLRLVNSVAGNQQTVEEFTNTDTCPIYRWLVDDCAFIKKFPGVDDDGIYRYMFQKACNRHQLCYTCGESYDIEYKLCNDVFEAELSAECGEDEECQNAAEQFLFTATNTYKRVVDSPSFCKERCLMQYLVTD